MQPQTLSGPPPPLTGDKLEIRFFSGQRPHQQWLEDPLFADRLGKSFKLGLSEPPPRLKCPLPDQLDRNTTLFCGVEGCGAIRLAEQSRKTAAELTPCRALAHRAPVPARRNTSAASRIYACDPAQPWS